LLAPFLLALVYFLLLFLGVMDCFLDIGAGIEVRVASCQP